MRASRFLMAALFVSSAVLVVEAQQPRRQGGGFGGFGFGGGGINGLVLSNAALQEELKVTPEQKEKFKAVTAKQEEMGKKAREAFKDGNKENAKERFAEMRKQGEALQEETKKVVDETLTAEQKKRLKQIDLQRTGVQAFATDDVAEALKLTDSQKTKLKSISDDFSKDRREVFGGGAGGKGGFGKGGFDAEKMAENQKKIDKLSKAAMSDIEEVLTAEQKKTWAEMVGAPFDVAKLRVIPMPRQKD